MLEGGLLQTMHLRSQFTDHRAILPLTENEKAPGFTTRSSMISNSESAELPSQRTSVSPTAGHASAMGVLI